MNKTKPRARSAEKEAYTECSHKSHENRHEDQQAAQAKLISFVTASTVHGILLEGKLAMGMFFGLPLQRPSSALKRATGNSNKFDHIPRHDVY